MITYQYIIINDYELIYERKRFIPINRNNKIILVNSYSRVRKTIIILLLQNLIASKNLALLTTTPTP